MWHVFLLQWKRLFKQPLLVLMFLGLTVVFVYFMGGAQINSTIQVPVYSESLTAQEVDEWIDRLNQDDTMVFEATDVETASENIRMNEIGFAMELDEDTYRFLAGREDERMPVVGQHVSQIFTEQIRLDEVREDFPEADIEVQDFVVVNESHSEAVGGNMDQYQFGLLIGMTFYFTTFSLLFLQMNLSEEKRLGTWNRLIFSPVSKTQVYLGHLLHYYLVGAGQVLLSFYILTNLLGVDLGDNYFAMAAVTLAFLFAIVSLGIFLTALVPSPQSLQVVIPIVVTSMAMLGGAFWPLDIVSNRFILFLSDLVPIKHGLNGMVDASLYGQSLNELLQPIGILLLMGILFMGIGINLMERVSNA